MIEEIVTFLTIFSLFGFSEWTAGIVYGVKKKAGVLLIILGCGLIVIFLIVGIANIDTLTSKWSWGSFVAGALNGLIVNSIWNSGVTFGSNLKERWQ